MGSMEGQNDRLYFEETQHFARWIRVIVLLPVAALGCLSLALFVEGSTRSALIPGGLALVFLLLAVPNWVMKLVTKLDARHLHLRLDPTGLPMPFLPPRVPLPHEHRDLEWNGSAAPAARRRANPCRIRSPRSARQRDHAGNERGPLVGRRRGAERLDLGFHRAHHRHASRGDGARGGRGALGRGAALERREEGCGE